MSKDMDSFDPNSSHAMFATILARIDGLRSDFQDFKKESKEADNRISLLESERQYRRGSMVIISVITGFFISVLTSVAAHWFTKG